MNRGHIEILIVVSSWAVSGGILIPWIHQDGLVIYGAGCAVATLYITFCLWRRGLMTEFKKTAAHWQALALVGFLITCNNGLFFPAMKITTVANAMLTHYFTPVLLVLFFAPVLLRHRPRPWDIFASLLGLFGLFIMLYSQLGSAAMNIGVCLGLGSAVFFAWHVVLESNIAQKLQLNPLIVVWYKNVVPAVLFFPYVSREIFRHGITFSDCLKLTVFGAVILGFSFTLLYRGLSKVRSQDASILFYLEPVGSILLAALIWGQGLSVSQILGGLLVLSSGVLTAVKKTDDL
ncbi:MAG: hypothetical protein A3F54_00890 [Candidatus Kerfeldbacteria bacterium RIFCSPHIGHO2_12_FULL_48_17]|uniref:EamA domain-containing protein n=1 Tax=Candidatus Kerfeldbacteria bacterium RIFCSPHIGHO2_12_FULL_48_17 TaxID=1798542 RepID=A0A1G2B4H0_9BACT|nr:MAG: hypothetical protein A3F54_00890 [Candidatus Kerfeldbacteria bacterium RIFCSPHIGHO2_12_FULL_48_17]